MKTNKVSSKIIQLNKPKYCRVPWSQEEKNITKEYFKKHILLNKAPKKSGCEEFQKKFPLLKNKPWRKIKTFIHILNYYYSYILNLNTILC